MYDIAKRIAILFCLVLAFVLSAPLAFITLIGISMNLSEKTPEPPRTTDTIVAANRGAVPMKTALPGLLSLFA